MGELKVDVWKGHVMDHDRPSEWIVTVKVAGSFNDAKRIAAELLNVPGTGDAKLQYDYQFPVLTAIQR